MTRRTALTALGAVAASTLRGQIHAPAKRPGPQLCVFSKNLAKVEYSELGAIAKELGFDGVDLTVRPGGHVEPNLVNVDLVRAIESVHGAELEVPMRRIIPPRQVSSRSRFMVEIPIGFHLWFRAKR